MQGWISVDRGSKVTLPLKMPHLQRIQLVTHSEESFKATHHGLSAGQA
jgi:hypothetical protein